MNEHYLFHGTRKEYIDAIITQGLDTRIASEKSMLGRGVYASESSTKADQYTGEITSCFQLCLLFDMSGTFLREVRGCVCVCVCMHVCVRVCMHVHMCLMSVCMQRPLRRT